MICRQVLYLGVLFGLVMLLPSCVASNPSPSPATLLTLGIAYRLPKTLVEINAKRSEIEQNVVEKNEKTKDDELTKKRFVEVKGDVTSLTVAEDTGRSLELVSGALADGSLGITVSPEGYLQAVNSSVQGKGADFISSIFQIIGRALALSVGIPAAAPGVAADPDMAPAPVACTASGLPVDVAIESFANNTPDRRFFGADTVGFYFVTHAKRGCDAWKDLLVAHANVRDQARRLDIEQAALKGTFTSAQAQAIEERIHHVTFVLKQLQLTETKKQTDFDDAFADFKKANHLNPETKSKVEMREAFALSEIPPLSLFDKLAKDKIKLALEQNNFKRMAAILDAGIAVARVDAVPSPPNAEASSTPKDAPKDEGSAVPKVDPKASTCEKTDVAYRDPSSVRLAVFQEDETAGTFKKSDEKTITAFESKDRCVKMEKSSMADRALVLEFGDFGVPKKFQRTNTSVAAKAANSVAAALTSLQNTYAESLEKVIAIQTSQRTIAQRDLADQIARLTKQKEFIDAQINFEGTAASKDMVLQQKQIEQQLSLLQKEIELRKTSQGAEVQVEIAGLKDRIALLEQQLALIQAQNKLQNPSQAPQP